MTSTLDLVNSLFDSKNDDSPVYSNLMDSKDGSPVLSYLMDSRRGGR